MNKIEYILDSDEIPNQNLKNDKFSIIIGLGFLTSIPIVFYLSIKADDHGLFLPRTEFIDSIIPNWFIHIKDIYELRCFEETVFVWVILYFIILGFLNIIFWKNSNKNKFRKFHAILTIGLALIFFMTMIEDDIYHLIKISDPLGRQEYENKVGVFYKLFVIWITTQLIYILAFIQDKLFSKETK